MKLMGYLVKSLMSFILVLHWLNCLWFLIAADQHGYIKEDIKWIPSSLM